MTKTQLTLIEQKISPIAQLATQLTIIDYTSLKTGVELLSKLNQYNDNIQEEKERVTAPLNQALKAERSRWKPLETMYQTAIDSIRAKMTSYQTQVVKARQEAEQSIVSRIGTGKGHIKVDTAVTKLESLVKVEKEHATDAGLVQFREKQQLKINNLNDIPRAYLVPDEALILKDLKNGEVVKGCEIEIIQIPVNYR